MFNIFLDWKKQILISQFYDWLIDWKFLANDFRFSAFYSRSHHFQSNVQSVSPKLVDGNLNLNFWWTSIIPEFKLISDVFPFFSQSMFSLKKFLWSSQVFPYVYGRGKKWLANDKFLSMVVIKEYFLLAVKIINYLVWKKSQCVTYFWGWHYITDAQMGNPKIMGKGTY